METLAEGLMESNVQTAVNQEVRVRKPDMYAVIMFNDEITTMDFVVEVLMKVFNKSAQEASNIMMEIHQKGHGLAGVFIYDIAVTKKMQADQMSAAKKFPLRLAVRPMDSAS